VHTYNNLRFITLIIVILADKGIVFDVNTEGSSKQTQLQRPNACTFTNASLRKFTHVETRALAVQAANV